jgi:hypothetical protein
MIKKEYYRLEELAKRFDVTFDEVRYRVEAGELNLSFYVNNKKFVLGGWQNGKDFIAFGIANYRGLVSIDSNKQMELIEQGSVKCQTVTLLNKNAITDLLLDYPFKTSIPNKLLAEWRSKVIEQIIWDVIPAKVCPTEHANIFKIAGQSLLNSLSDIAKKQGSNANVDLGAYDKYSDYQFEFDGLEFSTKDICVTHTELVKLGVVDSSTKELESNNITAEQLPDIDQPDKRISQLTTLIERVVVANPKIKAIEVWRKLREESELDSLDRKFDVEGILKDVTPNELLWESRYGNKTTVKKSTFDSKVSRIRKELGLNKK